jgi:N6-L-threonylcarbamoyladenine synthase
LNGAKIKLPFIGLVVSGGHTSLFYVKDFKEIETLGQTLDDACGEAFDKVAKILGLGYPGGPLIEKLAKGGDKRKIKFRCSGTKGPLDFSFSGIKTAVLYYVQRMACSVRRNVSRNKAQYAIRNTQYADIAASFQEVVIDTLIQKSLLACKFKKINRLVIGGGVVANNRLRERFLQEAKKKGVSVFFPSQELCLDNAAMVAGLGYQLSRRPDLRRAH